MGKIKGANAKFKQKINVGGNLARMFEGETLFNFGKKGGEDFSVVFGVGYVEHIIHGEKYDIVYISFGKRKDRRVIVTDSLPRRQIYTLTVNQLCSFYGEYREYLKKADDSNFHYKTYELFAKGLQGWYAPKQFDIKHSDLETEMPSEEEDAEITSILDNLVKN